MAAPRLITLLTDFGLTDGYVGMMKGVIAQIAPATRIIDLTHNLPPQDIRTASFQLASAYHYFPSGTIHIVVVDPGVGTERNAIAFKQGNYAFVGPDNGVFTGVLTQGKPTSCVSLDNPTYWYSSSPSRTFHGRDIFAPIGAHLSLDVDLLALGSPQDFEALTRLAELPWQPDIQGGTGAIQSIDHFGNLITNIPAQTVECQDLQSWSLRFKQRTVPGRTTFGDVAVGDSVAYVGSHGWIEFAINGGHAQSKFKAAIGHPVVLQLQTSQLQTS